MLTAGIDLGAEPDRTAQAVMRWDGRMAEVVEATLGVDDDQVVQTALGAAVTGIDCPFGWPDRFVDLVVEHRNGRLVPPNQAGRDWRRDLVLRKTDRYVQERTGLTPLSVSADRIGHVALRCAALLARLARFDVDCARDGSGRVAEVYPAAALHRWGLTHRGYKRTANAVPRGQLVDTLSEHSWLILGGAEPLCRRSDDVLDAVLSALVARAVALACTERPPADLAPAGRTEGWIHLPTTDLSGLVAPADKPALLANTPHPKTDRQ